MNRDIVAAAFVALDRTLQLSRNAKFELEAFAWDGDVTPPFGFADPKAAFMINLQRSYEASLLILELAALPETRSRLIQQWVQFESANELAPGDYDPEYDYIESKPLEYLETIAETLRSSAGVRKGRNDDSPGTRVFIGHGKADDWRTLRDLLTQIGLACEEFNRIPTAGVTTVDRLKEMLTSAAFAFLVLTAEDELSDGGRTGRLNVIHEAGLFQGHLGFGKAILLVEDGCEAVFQHRRAGTYPLHQGTDRG